MASCDVSDIIFCNRPSSFRFFPGFLFIFAADMSLPLSPFRLAALLTLLAGLCLALPDWLSVDGEALWTQLYVQESTLTYFCEPAVVEAFIRQPADTFSNLGFLFVGVAMLAFGWRDRQQVPNNFVGAHPSWSFLFGGAMVFTFLGSAFFHASLSRLAEWLDLAAVYSAMWIPIFFNLHRLQNGRKGGMAQARPWQLAFVAVWCLCCGLIFQVNAWFTMPIALLLIGITSTLVQRKHPGDVRLLALSMLLSLFAVMWFVFDIRRILCDPESWFQPHAIWHLSDAATAGTFYAFMRSSKYSKKSLS